MILYVSYVIILQELVRDTVLQYVIHVVMRERVRYATLVRKVLVFVHLL